MHSGSAIEVTKLLEDDDWAEIAVGNRTGYCMTSFLMKGARAVSDKLGYTMIYDDALFDYESKDGGGWFKAGKAFKNHTCSAKSNKKLVQCPDCGDWFPAGNVFRNHQCVNYPSEDNPEL